MKKIAESEYAIYFWLGLLLTVLCAWFSIGYYQQGEHFQVLEFANYKLGGIDANHMTWEFQVKIRAALLPYAVYLFIKVLGFMGIHNPFTITFLIRLITGVTTWYVFARMCLFLMPGLKTNQGKKIFVLMCMFLWFIPFLNVRFASENVAGLLFLCGTYYLLKPPEDRSFLAYAFVGFVFGIAFYIRIQVVFAIVGFLAFFIYTKQLKLKNILIMTAFGIIAIGLNYIIDSMFYGEPLFTPYSYFYVNIIANMSHEFGQMPFWFYFSEVFAKALPPLSLFLLTFFFTGIYKHLKDPFVWAIVPFVIAHSFIAHKELRFLFSVLIPFIYISALGLDYWLQNKLYLKWHKVVYIVSLVVCIPALAYRSFAPADPGTPYCKHLYDNVNKKNTPFFLLSNQEIDCTIFEDNSAFYKSPNIIYEGWATSAHVAGFVKINKPEVAFCLGNKVIGITTQIPGYKVTSTYCYLPDWALKYNINNWENRAGIMCIYKLTKN